MSTETAPPLCPRDGNPLEIHRSATAELWSCPECHGIRVEPAALEALVRSDERPPLRYPEAEVEPVEGTALCSCPGQPLMHRVIRHEDRLSLDVCPECGAHWFDAGEIQCYLAERRSSLPESLGPARSLPSVLLERGWEAVVWLFLGQYVTFGMWKGRAEDASADPYGDFAAGRGWRLRDGSGPQRHIDR